MDLDAKVCYCFHVSRRKLENHLRIYRPRVASQMSECGGAGTGCGWCIPLLKRMHEHARETGGSPLEEIDITEYARQRAAYVRAGKGTPPPGATPLTEES